MTKKTSLMFLVLVLVMSLSVAAQASISIYWTDLTSVSVNNVYGTLAIGSENIGVTINNTVNYSFVTTGSGTNYWGTGNYAAYKISGVSYAPPASDIVALSSGGTITITFSKAVTNPVIGLSSWNGNTVDFNGTDINFLSYGQGYWGNGTPVINSDGDGFYGNGEVHGIVELPGTFSSITFTNTSESWHGFTVGAEGLASAPVPVPAAVWLLGSGLFGLFGIRRKIRQ